VIRNLRGITWNHPRGLSPLVACAREHLSRTGVEVEWLTRSLQGFADAPLPELAREFDLVVFDHPHLGEVAESGAFLPIADHVDPSELLQWRDSAGPSYESYLDEVGQLWGVPIDAAGTVAAWRPDLLAKTGVPAPATWLEYLATSRAATKLGRFVAIPLLPIDALTALMTLLANRGTPPSLDIEFAPQDALVEELERLRELSAASHSMSLTSSPLEILDRMSTSSDLMYAPLIFGYSNYARSGFRTHSVEFGAFPSAYSTSAGGTLGGAGIGISRTSDRAIDALGFARFVGSTVIQQTTYVENDGQPASRAAWTSDHANRLTNNYFRHTLPLMEQQYLRPRYAGYLQVQGLAGRVIHDFLSGKGTAEVTAKSLNIIVDESHTTGVQRHSGRLRQGEELDE